MRSAATLFLAAALFVARVRADYAFVECADPLLITSILTGVVNIILTAGSVADSYTGCPTYCQGTQGTTYSAYQPGLFGLLSSCYCTNIQPTSLHAVAGSNSAGNCPSGTYQVNYLGPPANLLDFTGCTTGGIPGSGSPAAFSTPNADQCFTTCQTYKYLILIPSSGPNFSCQCANFLTPGSSATCNVGVQNIYNNAAMAPSGGARKRRNQEMQKRIAENNSPCPRDTEACLIPGSDHAWECVDTSSDLESCGEYLPSFLSFPWRAKSQADALLQSSTSPTAMLPALSEPPASAYMLTSSCTIGAAVGGASCSRGICKQWRCTRGWVLEKGRCVRKFGTNQERRLH